MKTSLSHSRGSVSVFFLIIFIPIFCFQAVLTDWVRIKLAEQQTELALKAALRSVMTSFDSQLITYGLFGQSATLPDQKNQFLEHLRINLNLEALTEHEDREFSLSQPLLEGEPSLTGLYSLANETVFKQQVMEEMKYRGPIEFTLQFIDKFKKPEFEEAAKQSVDYSLNMEELEKLIAKRDKAVAESFEHLEELARQVQSMHRSYQRSIQVLIEKSKIIGDHSLTQLNQRLDQLEREIDSVERSIQSYIQALSLIQDPEGALSMGEAISSLNRQLSELSSQKSTVIEIIEAIGIFEATLAMMKKSLESDSKYIGRKSDAIEQELSDAKQAERELRQKIEKISSNSDSSTGTMEANKVAEHIPMLGDTYFDQYKTDLATVMAAFESFHQLVFEVQTPADTNNKNLLSLNQAYERKIQALYSTKKREMLDYDERRAQVDQAQNEEKDKYTNIVRQITDVLGACATDTFISEYQLLSGTSESQGYFDKYRQYNERVAVSSVSGENFYSEAPDNLSALEAGKKAIGIMDRLRQSTVDLRDHLYLNEYALSKFNYRNLGEERDRFGKLKVAPSELSEPLNHPLKQQEAEYILYGAGSCIGNHTAAASEIFLTRLAIRTMENLMEPKRSILAIGSPLLVFLTALAEAAAEASKDLLALLKGHEVELSSRLPKEMTLNYKDYLRMFMLLHGDKSSMMHRMMALIELNIGVSLEQTQTYMLASVQSRLKLWYMPAVMKLTGKEVDHRHAIIRKQAVYAY